MRWIAFFILAYGVLGIQTGINSFVRIQSPGGFFAEPNFGLLAVVFIGLFAPSKEALLGCFTLGAMQDLATQQPLGFFAFSYGLTALILIGASQAVYREHPLTHVSCALLGGCVTAAIVLARHLVRHSPWTPMPLFGGAIYTAMLAPFVVGGLGKIRKLFAFQPARRKARAW
jgi:rod shape-determining protein MreD